MKRHRSKAIEAVTSCTEDNQSVGRMDVTVAIAVADIDTVVVGHIAAAMSAVIASVALGCDGSVVAVNRSRTVAEVAAVAATVGDAYSAWPNSCQSDCWPSSY